MDDMQLNRKLAEIFFLESGEMLSEASIELLKAEESGNAQGVIDQVFRAIHSIKGGAQSLDFGQLVEVAHRLEDFLMPLQRTNCAIDEQSVSLILEAMDVLEIQLIEYQTGEPIINYTLLLEKLAKNIKVVPIVNVSCNTLPETVITRQEQIVSSDSKLLYISFIVDPSAIMPSVTAIMLLEKLLKNAKLIYSKPDFVNPGMAVAGEYFEQIAIIQTAMCNADVKREAYRISDICEIKVTEINNSIFQNADKPAKSEIVYFNSLVGKMQEILCCKNIDKTYLNTTLRQIVNWGWDSSGVAEWFPGGLPAWQKMTSVLTEIVATAEQVSPEIKMSALLALQTLWETVYNALCNQTYFYSLPVSDILEGKGGNVIEQLQVSAVDVQVVSIDLSNLTTLECEHLKALADFRELLAKNGWLLWLTAKGEYSIRHRNVLEIATGIVGVLEFYFDSYSAIITSQQS